MKNSYKSIRQSLPFLRKMNKKNKTKQNEQKTCLGKSQKKQNWLISILKWLISLEEIK